jgi:hypothetical protein
MDHDLELVKLLEPSPGPADPIAAARQRELLLVAIDAEIQPPVTPTRHAHRPRAQSWRLRVLLGAATLAIAGLGTAVAVSTITPDRNDVATIERRATSVAPGHTPGWRPELNAETVGCDYKALPQSSLPEGFPSIAQGSASGFPLAQALTEDDLVTECASGTDAVREHPVTGASHVLCVAHSPEIPTAQRTAGRTIGEGTPKQAEVPVVVFASASCSTAGYEPPARGLLDDINRRRQQEAAILAVPGTCPSHDEALDWTLDHIHTTGITVTLIDEGTSPGGSCYLPAVHWNEGTVYINATVQAGSPGTVPPTAPS